MKVTYDPQADAMYIYLSDKKSTRTEEVSGDLLVDFNEKTPVGIELLGVSRKLAKTERNNITLSLLTGAADTRPFASPQ